MLCQTILCSFLHTHTLIIHHFIGSNFAKLERKRHTRTHIRYEYEYLKKEEHRFYRYINVVFQMITICSGILFCCCYWFLYIFFVCRLFGKLFVRFCMFCLFYFFISNFKRCARHKTQTQTESEKTKSKRTKKAHDFCRSFVIVDCVCAQRYPRFVTPASSRPHQTPVVGKLSVVKCGAQDKTTRESRERQRERKSKAEIERENGSFCLLKLCELLWSESAHWLYTIRQPCSNKTGQNISNHEGCSCHCCWGPCPADQERLLEKLARFEERPYTLFKINKQVKNLQLMKYLQSQLSHAILEKYRYTDNNRHWHRWCVR